MTELLPSNALPYVLPATGALLLLAGFLWWRRQRRQSLAGVIDRIAFERLSDFVIPNTDEGEIHIDHLLLTAEGLLVLDVKDIEGIVFGSDKMKEWSVIGKERRYTIQNPQPALYDRIAAVREIVRQVPVEGRLLFLDGAEFTKGVPSLVCSLDDLLQEFADGDATGAASRIDAFKPHWEQLRAATRET